jgi:iron complex outermembrane receptor protein
MALPHCSSGRTGPLGATTALALILAPALSGAVYAEAPQVPAAGGTDTLAEIVVTAQFRKQNLQETPLAITALSGASLEGQGIDTVAGVANTAPNVVLEPGGAAYGPAATAFIRGVGQNDDSFALEPGVGMYVDDVYHGVLYGALFDLFDLDRVEVLRGPQGTLEGKNSIGGSIKLYTQKPDGNGGGYAEVGSGSFSRINVKAAGDFVLVPDRLFVRLSGMSKKADGYLTDYDYACTHPGTTVPGFASTANCELGKQGGQDVAAGRVAVRWLATSNLEVNLAADMLNDDSEVAATKLLAINIKNNIIPAGVSQTQFMTGPTSYSNYANYYSGPFTDPASLAGAPGAGSHPASPFGAYNQLRTYDVNGNIDWHITDNLDLKSITAYQEYKGAYSNDIDLTPYPVSTAAISFRTRQFTQELRLSGSLRDPHIEWTLGAFYYDSNSHQGGTSLLTPGLAGETISSSNDDIPSTSKSVFAHSVWHATAKLSVIGGVRYTKDHKDYRFGRLDPFNHLLPAYTAAGALNGTTGSYDGSHVDYRAVLQYQWTDDIMTYAQFSTGYRGGGVNPRPYVLEQEVPFAPETVDAYELGSKMRFFDQHLQFNLAGFYSQYKNIVFTNTTPTAHSLFNATPVNAGDADIGGVEAELQVRPYRSFTIDASASWLDFRFTRIGAAGATIAGVTLSSQEPYAPKYKFSLGAQYAFDLGKAGSLTPRLDLSDQASFFTNINDNWPGRVAGYALLNGHLTWNSFDSLWQLRLDVLNATDKFYYLNKIQYPLGTTLGTPAPPRTFLVTLRRSF